MQTRNQKSIKFSVFTNTLVFFHGSVWARVYVVCIWSAAQFPFAFISAQSGAACAGQDWHSVHTAPWRLDPVNQLSFDQWVSVSGYNRAHFYCPRFKFSHRDFVGEGAWWSELQYRHVTGPDGSRGPGCPLTCDPCATIIEPILLLTSGQKLISRRWELPTTKYSNWNWNNKHKHREGRQAAKCAQSSIKPGPGNLVSQVCPLYSQSQELTFHWMKEDLNPLTSHGQYVFCFCRIVLHFSFIEDVLSLHFVSAWEVQNRKVNPIVG